MREDLNVAYVFGPFRLEPQQRRLLKNDQEVTGFTTTLFKILYFLVQDPQKRLSKEAIQQAVWHNTTVNEENLTRQISTLRGLLDNDDANNPHYIRTIHGFGYEFLVPVTLVPGPKRGRQRWRLLISAGLLVSLLIGGLWWRFRPVDPHTLRVQLSSCDDECILFLNGTEILRTTLGQPATAWRDITTLLRPGKNELRLRVTNNVGAIAYGLQIQKGGLLVVREQCGIAHRVGCNDNENYPVGPVVEIAHTFYQ